MCFLKISGKSVAYCIFLLFIVFDLRSVTAENDSVIDPASPPTCYSCEGVNCLRISKLNATTECADTLDYCVTIFKGFTVIARGCYSALPSNLREKCDLATHPECTKCIGNRCNDKGREDFKCIECSSSKDNKCATDARGMPGIQCPIPTAQNSYCFVRKSPDGATHRGCLVHQREQRDCLNDSQCSMCVSDFSEACNSYKLATRITTSGVGRLVRNDNVNRVIGVVFILVMLLRYNQ